MVSVGLFWLVGWLVGWFAHTTPKKHHGRSNLDTCRLGMYYDLPNTFERNVKKGGNTL